MGAGRLNEQPPAVRRLAGLVAADGVSHVRPFIDWLREHPLDGRLLLVRPATAVVAFSSRDRLSPQFSLAQQRAREHAFTPVLRAVGGTFAPLHAGSLIVEEYGSSRDASLKNSERFESHSRAMVATYAAAGVAAAVGELPGEYCPGRYSIHSAGAKVSGTAQRVSRTAWVVSTVVQVASAQPLHPVTAAVAAALGQHVDVTTVGSLVEAGARVATPAELAPLVGAAFGGRPGDRLSLPLERRRPPGAPPEGFVWWLRPASIR